MDTRIEVEAVEVAELGEAELALWRALRTAHPHLASPYFDPRYVEAVARVAPDGRVAVIRRGGRGRGLGSAWASGWPQQGMENIALKQQTEDLPYHRAMDAQAQVFDLEPGLAAAWPLHAPHRIENQGTFNVSLSVDYQTWGSRLTNGAHYANGVLRRWGAPVAPMHRTPMAARAGLWAASLAMKRFGLVEDRIKGFERSFELGDAKA